MMIKAMIQIDNYESWFVVGFVLFFNFIFHEVFDIFFIFDVDDLIVFAFPIDLWLFLFFQMDWVQKVSLFWVLCIEEKDNVFFFCCYFEIC